MYAFCGVFVLIAQELRRLKGKMLRVGVAGGGCGGFQYTLKVEEENGITAEDMYVI